MNKDFVYCEIIDIIKKHRDLGQAINQHKITKILNNNNWCGEDGITARSVRRMIEELIELGNPIISSPRRPGGYCWEGGPGEALECYKRLRRKAAKEFKRARYTLRNMYKGQLSLFDARKVARG